MTLMIT